MEAVLASGISLGLVNIGPELFFQIFNTLVLFAFLRWKLFGPITAMLQKRTDRIKASFDEADGKVKSAEDLRLSYEKKMSLIKEEEALILSEARHKAEKRAFEIIKHAEEEIAHKKAQAVKDMEQEREKAINQMKNEIVSLVMLTASKVIDQELDGTKHSALITDFIERVGDSKWHN